MHTTRPVALITGAAHRIGKSIAEQLHQRNVDIALHCFSSVTAANELCTRLNQLRAGSCRVFYSDLSLKNQSKSLIAQVIEQFNRLDFLVNNASIFYPTPFVELLDEAISSINSEQNFAVRSNSSLMRFMQVNLFTPITLSQEAYPYLKKHNGAIVNLIDIYAKAGLINHTEYVTSKAALLSATKTLAQQFAPKVRVNGISPGAILWPETEESDIENKPATRAEKENTKLQDPTQSQIISNTALKRRGQADDIGKTATYLLLDASYSTGNTIAVDGGRQLYI